MNKRNVVLVIGLMLFTIPVLAAIESNPYKFITNFFNIEKCSSEIEQLKLCVDPTKLTVDSGEKVTLKLRWVNSANLERQIIGRAYYYGVTVKNEKGEEQTPILQKKIEDGSATSEDWSKWIRLNSGSSRGITIEPNQTKEHEINLTEGYNYDFTAKGIYSVTIRKTIPSLESGKTIEFVIDGIEIEVK